MSKKTICQETAEQIEAEVFAEIDRQLQEVRLPAAQGPGGPDDRIEDDDLRRQIPVWSEQRDVPVGKIWRQAGINRSSWWNYSHDNRPLSRGDRRKLIEWANQPEMMERFHCLPAETVQARENPLSDPCAWVDPVLGRGQELLVLGRYDQAATEFHRIACLAASDTIRKAHATERLAQLSLLTFTLEDARRYPERSKAHVRDYLGVSEAEILRHVECARQGSRPAVSSGGSHPSRTSLSDAALGVYCMAAYTAFHARVEAALFAHAPELLPAAINAYWVASRLSTYLIERGRPEFGLPRAHGQQGLALYSILTKQPRDFPFKCLDIASTVFEHDNIGAATVGATSEIVDWRLGRAKAPQTGLLKAVRRLAPFGNSRALVLALHTLSRVSVQSEDWPRAVSSAAAAASLMPHGCIVNDCITRLEDAHYAGIELRAETVLTGIPFVAAIRAIQPLAHALHRSAEQLLHERVNFIIERAQRRVSRAPVRTSNSATVAVGRARLQR